MLLLIPACSKSWLRVELLVCRSITITSLIRPSSWSCSIHILRTSVKWVKVSASLFLLTSLPFIILLNSFNLSFFLLSFSLLLHSPSVLLCFSSLFSFSLFFLSSFFSVSFFNFSSFFLNLFTSLLLFLSLSLFLLFLSFCISFLLL